MNDLTFDILKIIVSISCALISAYLIPFIHSKLQDVKYQNLLEIVEIAVRAAEQTVAGAGKGKRKKQEVITFVTTWAKEHGVSITEEQLSQLIEAAVFNMNLEK